MSKIHVVSACSGSFLSCWLHKGCGYYLAKRILPFACLFGNKKSYLVCALSLFFQSDGGGAFKGFKGLVASSGGGGFSGFGNGAGGKPLEGLSNGNSITSAPSFSSTRAATETKATFGE